MARQTLFGDTNGTGPYRIVREGMEAPPDDDAATRLRLVDEKIKMVRWQLDLIHSELGVLLAEEKALLDEMHGVRT